MLLKKLFSAVLSAATSRINVPGPLQGHLCCTKTTPDSVSSSQVSERKIRSLVKYSKKKSNTAVSVFLKTLGFIPQRIKSGKNTRVLSVFGWGYAAQQFMAGFCFPCVWNPRPKSSFWSSVVSKWVCVNRVSRDTSWAITWPCQPCLWQIPAAKCQVLLEHQPGWERGTDLDGCRGRESWQLWDHPVHTELCALCVWAPWYSSLPNAFWWPKICSAGCRSQNVLTIT